MVKKILSEAIKALKNGELIVYPTDTVYGLGADIYQKKAVKKVFEIKKRSFSLPISVGVSNFEELENISYVDTRASILAERFLPGKLTLILKKKGSVNDIITAGKKNIAVRIPDNKIALNIFDSYGPLTCTSANIHGKKTPSTVDKIVTHFNSDHISVFINDGYLQGKPSTIVDLSDKQVKLVREGDITFDEVLGALEDG